MINPGFEEGDMRRSRANRGWGGDGGSVRDLETPSTAKGEEDGTARQSTERK